MNNNDPCTNLETGAAVSQDGNSANLASEHDGDVFTLTEQARSKDKISTSNEGTVPIEAGDNESHQKCTRANSSKTSQEDVVVSRDLDTQCLHKLLEEKDVIQEFSMQQSPSQRDLGSNGANGDVISENSSVPLKVIKNANGIAENVASESDNGPVASVTESKKETKAQLIYRIGVLGILLLANLLNYIDRSTVAGVLPLIKSYYSHGNSSITDAQAGLLQTSFIVIYMFFSPLFGYLGDRYNRTGLMSLGIVMWSAITLAGSFIPSHLYWVFVLMRGLVGIGMANYTTVAPSVIADLFTKDQRSKAIACFYFAIPVGSGLGYIVGSLVANLTGEWQWALRVTPAVGLLCALLIFTCVKEPPRGAAEGLVKRTAKKKSGFRKDLVYLLKNKSYILSTLGVTGVAFMAGALAFWAPTFMQYGIEALHSSKGASSTGLKFGVITCLAGLLGVLIGSETARRLRHRFKRADPHVCAFGLITSAPLLFLALYLAGVNVTASWLLIFLAELFLCMNWSIVTDIMLYVVIPTRRAIGEAFQILVSHSLGDAGSPYLVGLMSDLIKGSDTSVFANFVSLQYALYSMTFVAVIAGVFFLATATFLVADKAKADKFIKDEANQNAAEMKV